MHSGFRLVLWSKRPGGVSQSAWQSVFVCVCVPDGQQFVQQISSSGQQSPSGQIERLPPPRVRAQSWHYPAVVLQWVGDDVPVQRELPIGGQQPAGEALVLAKVNYTRPRPGKPDAPVHALCLRPLSASLWQLGVSSAGASWVQWTAEVGRLDGEHPCGRMWRPVRSLSPQRGRHPPLPARRSLDAGNLPPVDVKSDRKHNFR